MNRRHDTEGMRKHAVDSSLWWEFKPGQRVRTKDGLLGTVTGVEDGPFAGAEHYLVELDGGMGGGEYSSSELMATAEGRTASKQSAELHVASDDYPVLEDILEERPPLENVQQRWAAVQTENFSDDVRNSPPSTVDMSTYDTQDTDRRWEDPQYYDKAYQSSLKGDLNEHVGFFFRSEPGVGRSYDWCRFRRQQHCFYPKGLNEAATKIEGVPVWIPEDRGICSRHDWDEQRACPVSEPGPRSRETIYYPDATVPYEAGGQRRDNYRAFHTNYKAPLTNFDLITNVTLSMKDEDFSMHYTSAWIDVMNKARYLRRSGNVFIFSAPERGTGNTDFIVGEVLGDSGIPYRVRLMREPNTRRIAMWECGCAWGHYAWGRSGRWKKFEGRMCSHALSLLYEVQGREGFGGDRQIWENTETPIWRDADEEPQERHPVDDYSYRDWRVGSLEMPEGPDFGMEREGNWRPVEWNDDFEHAPIVLMASHEVMSAEANKSASRGGFPVQWRGQTEWVVQMDTQTSSVILSNGVETNCYELLHPRYHPTLGLNVNESGDYEPMYKGAVLKDEPEPALPRTEGEEDDDFLFEAEKPRPMQMLDMPDEQDDAPPPPEPTPAAPEVEEDEEPEDTIQVDASRSYIDLIRGNTLYRGMTLKLSEQELEDFETMSSAEKLRLIASRISNTSLGLHWTDTLEIAKRFAAPYQWDANIHGQVAVIVTTDVLRSSIMSEKEILAWNDKLPNMDKWIPHYQQDPDMWDSEREFPIRLGESINVNGFYWLLHESNDDWQFSPANISVKASQQSIIAKREEVVRPEWLMSGGGSRKSSGRDGGISNSDIASQARKVLAAKTFSPDEQAELIGEGEGTVAARNLDRLDIVGTHYEALERIDAEEEEDNYDNLWGMLL
jgi:hypothetical protein